MRRKPVGPMFFDADRALAFVRVYGERLDERGLQYVKHLRSGRRVRWEKADELATTLGFHPAEIWPEWFE